MVVYDSVLSYSTANTLPYRPQVTFKGSYLGTKTPYGSHITQPINQVDPACLYLLVSRVKPCKYKFLSVLFLNALQLYP